jgi:hypothetical protein
MEDRPSQLLFPSYSGFKIESEQYCTPIVRRFGVPRVMGNEVVNPYLDHADLTEYGFERHLISSKRSATSSRCFLVLISYRKECG